MATVDIPQSILDYAVTASRNLSEMTEAGMWASDIRIIDDYEAMKGYVLKIIVMTKAEFDEEQKDDSFEEDDELGLHH